jgi:hypothetical protein
MKKHSTSLATKEMQIKTVKIPSHPKLAITRKTTDAGNDTGEKRTLIHCWWDVN